MQTIPQKFDTAVRHHRAGELSQAESLYRQVLAEQPDHADALHLLGVIAYQMGRNVAALDLIRRSISLNPGWHKAYSNLGNALTTLGQLDGAVAAYRQAIALAPDHPDAYVNLGIALGKEGKVDEAVTAYHQAIAVRPDSAAAWSNLGNALADKGQIDQAIAAYRRAIAFSPDYAEPYNNLGNAFKAKGQLDEAIAVYRQALALQPNYSNALSNLGAALSDLGRLDEALAVYRQSIALNPDFPEAHYNLSQTLLLQGQFSEGWEKYEWRWRIKDFPSSRPTFSQPRWDGSNMPGRTLLIYGEQGLGDTIQFIRLVPLVAGRCGKLVVICQPQLKRLLESVPGVERWMTPDEPWPSFDVHCPLLSLPFVLGINLQNIPASVPYLRAASNGIVRWRERLSGDGARLNVGLVWAGHPGHKNDRNRSLPLSCLAALAKVQGVTFHSLQLGPAAHQAKAAPGEIELVDWTGDLHDFAETAALITNLDLVICVDTAVAHVAGAMGKPVWVLLPFVPDWRWLLDREDTPWYPTMRLFRQKSAGKWDEVIERVAESLRWLVMSTREMFDAAIRHYRAGDLPRACDMCQQVLAKDPSHADALHMLGVMAYRAGRDDPAVDFIRRAIALRPDWHEAHSSLGNALARKGQFDEAIGSFQRAIALRPDYAEAHVNLGVALKGKGDLDQAIIAYRQAIALRPKSPEAYVNLGNILAFNGKMDEAIAAYQQAVALRPDFPEAYGNAAHAHFYNGQLDAAIAAARQAIALKPNYPEAHYNLASALRLAGQLDEAAAASRQAIALRPGYPEAHCSLGNALEDKGEPQEAIAAYRRAIALRSHYPTARYNLGLALLRHGDWSQGWQEYEWRWNVEGSQPRPGFSQPKWDGSNLPGGTLLLHTEQGLGDAIQFARYVPLVAGRCPNVIAVCPPELRRLLQSLPGVALWIVPGETLPRFDAQCPLLSLPLAFGTTLENPPRSIPYLHADAAEIQRWRNRLANDGPGLKVGLAWAGSKTHKNDHNRSLPLSILAPLAQARGAKFYSLQKGEPADQAKSPPPGMKLIDWTQELNDFADTAAFIANLDLVISVDTAVVHVAGAIGKPVWTLLPFTADWRWMLDREDSPWYPTMRLFRQKEAGRWGEVIERVVEELMKNTGKRGVLGDA